MKWHFIVALIHISLMTHDVECLFMYSLTFVCLLWKNIYSDPQSILTRLFVLLLLNCEFPWIQIPHQIYDLQIFYPILCNVFRSIDVGACAHVHILMTPLVGLLPHFIYLALL